MQLVRSQVLRECLIAAIAWTVCAMILLLENLPALANADTDWGRVPDCSRDQLATNSVIMACVVALVIAVSLALRSWCPRTPYTLSVLWVCAGAGGSTALIGLWLSNWFPLALPGARVGMGTLLVGAILPVIAALTLILFTITSYVFHIRDRSRDSANDNKGKATPRT